MELPTQLRWLAERMSRGVVLRRRLPKDLGGHRLFVSPDASLRLWRRRLESTDPDLLALARELVHPGMSVWDIGANVGLFTMAAAHLAGTGGNVLAVEADGWLAELIRRSARHAAGSVAPIQVLAAAVADRGGALEFAIALRGRAASHLASVSGSSQGGGARERRLVPAVVLDSLLDSGIRPPDVLKIDVEGAETLCLAGATRLLAGARPIIVCEVSDANSGDVAALLCEAGYQFYDSLTAAEARRPLDTAPWMCLAIPMKSQAGRTC